MYVCIWTFVWLFVFVVSRSNHLLESTTGSMSSSQSPLPSSRSSPFLSSQGSRSRHNSSQGYNSIAAWLKDIRLHKYTDKLAKYTWEEVSFPCRLNIHAKDISLIEGLEWLTCKLTGFNVTVWCAAIWCDAWCCECHCSRLDKSSVHKVPGRLKDELQSTDSTAKLLHTKLVKQRLKLQHFMSSLD